MTKGLFSNINLWASGPSGNILAAGVAVVALTLSPIAFWLFAPHIFALQGRRRAAVISATLGFVPTAYLLGSFKAAGDDWGWYSAHFFAYSKSPLSEIFSDNFFPENQIEEPLYYLLAWFLAQVFPGQLEWLVVLINILVYSAICVGVFVASRAGNFSPFQAVGFSYVMVSVAVVVTLNLILVRQQLAIVMVFLAWALLTNKSPTKSSVAAIAAIGFHSSAVVPAVFLFLAHVLGRTARKIAITLSFPLGLSLGLLYFLLLGSDYDQRSDGQISFTLIIFAILIVLLQTKFDYGEKALATPLNSDLLMAVMALGFVVGTGGAAIPALRFFFYGWMFVAIIFWRVVDRVIPAEYDARLAGVWALVGFAAVQARVWANPEGYLVDSFTLITLLAHHQ